jgi:hypothetical protein
VFALFAGLCALLFYIPDRPQDSILAPPDYLSGFLPVVSFRHTNHDRDCNYGVHETEAIGRDCQIHQTPGMGHSNGQPTGECIYAGCYMGCYLFLGLESGFRLINVSALPDARSR